MAQQLIRDFVRDLIALEEMPDPVVEFGSLITDPEAPDDHGDMRPLFVGRSFTGTDFREGPGVDRIEDLRALTFADGELGTALCLDTLEHCEDPPQACRELTRVVGTGGICVITSVMLFGIHAYPNDYYRFTPEAFRSLLRGFDDCWVAGIGDPDIPTQVVGVGVKGRKLDLSIARLPSLAGAQAGYDAAAGKVRFGPIHIPPRDLLKGLARDAPRLARERLQSVAGRAHK